MKKHLLLFCIFLFTLLTAFSATFTVTSNLDTGAGTLRAALNSASLTAGGPHQIVFASAMIISLNTSLGINNNINLSGLTINGWVDNIEGPDVTIRSLVNFSNTGIDIESANNIKVYGIVFQNLEFGIKFRQGCKGG